MANALLQNAVGMSAVITALLLARPWLYRHARPQTRYAAWLILCVGLLLPFRLGVTPFWTMTAPQARGPIAMQTPAPASAERLLSATAAPRPHPAGAPGLGQGAAPQAAVPLAQAQESGARLSFQWPDPYTLLILLWVLGTAVALVTQLLRHLRFFRRIRRWQSEPGEQQRRILQEEQRRLGIKGNIPLMGCACVASPMVVGLLRPKVLIPETDLGEEELRLILRHELTHVKRRDLWGKALMLACLMIHWFNPLVYAMARAMASDCEMSRDASVLANAEMIERKRYGETILGIVRRQNKKQIALSTYFYEGKIDMKKRFASMLDASVRPKGKAVLAVALMLTLLSGSVLAIDNVLPASTGSAAQSAEATIPADWDRHPTPALFSNTGDMNPQHYQLSYESPEPTPYSRMLTRVETLRMYDLYYFYDHDGRRAAQPVQVAKNAENGFAVSASVADFAALIPLQKRTENVYGPGLWDGPDLIQELASRRALQTCFKEGFAASCHKQVLVICYPWDEYARRHRRQPSGSAAGLRPFLATGEKRRISYGFVKDDSHLHVHGFRILRANGPGSGAAASGAYGFAYPDGADCNPRARSHVHPYAGAHPGHHP